MPLKTKINKIVSVNTLLIPCSSLTHFLSLMKVFFISETYRADAQTWIRGLKEFGQCEVETWELKKRTGPFARLLRMIDWFNACLFLGRKVKNSGADILLSERITSYGFLAACTGFHPFVVAQQGITDVWPPDSF